MFCKPYPQLLRFVENFRISFIGLLYYPFYLSILFFCYYFFYFIPEDYMIHTASKNATVILSVYSFVEVIEDCITKQKSLHAVMPFKKGALISKFSAGDFYDAPNYLTVQTGTHQHITLDPAFLQYSNHSCSPNIFFDTAAMEIIALRDIEPSEELCFFYPSAEWDMAQPFICYCGSRNCLQNIRGAKYVAINIIHSYRLTYFIEEQLKKAL